MTVRETQPVTIVIPVFNAVEEVNRCLLTVQQTVSAATEVLLIDDAQLERSEHDDPCKCDGCSGLAQALRHRPLSLSGYSGLRCYDPHEACQAS